MGTNCVYYMWCGIKYVKEKVCNTTFFRAGLAKCFSHEINQEANKMVSRSKRARARRLNRRRRGFQSRDSPDIRRLPRNFNPNDASISMDDGNEDNEDNDEMDGTEEEYEFTQ